MDGETDKIPVTIYILPNAGAYKNTRQLDEQPQLIHLFCTVSISPPALFYSVTSITAKDMRLYCQLMRTEIDASMLYFSTITGQCMP